MTTIFCNPIEPKPHTDKGIRMTLKKCYRFGLLLAFVYSSQSFAVTVSDDFTQAIDANNWVPEAYACLTAGVTANNTTANSKIPGCNYTTPDAIGGGALRLTPAQNNQHGAIVSGFTFPSSQGLQATFTTYSYGGSKDGLAGEGADGLSFFLMDGSVPTTLDDGSTNLGSWGGSLAYSCSNVNPPYVGLTGAYLGLGMDEYGNFLNGGSGNDNTATGIPIQTSSSSTNGYNSFTSGSYQQANRIGLRGAGNVSWWWLNHNYPVFYPSGLSDANKKSAVQSACKTGMLSNYSTLSPSSVTALSSSGNVLTVTVAGHGYSNGDTVSLGGTIADAVPAAKAISAASSSSTTLTVTVNNHGFANGDSVTLGGAINATTLSPSKTITSFGTCASNVVKANVSNNGYSNGDTVVISGAANSAFNGTFTISSTSTNSFKFPCTGSATSAGGGAVAKTTTASIAGSYPILGVTANTFNVTLAAAPSAIVNTTGTARLTSVPNIPGSYTISGVTTNTFNVTLASTIGAITNTSGTVANTTPTTTAVLDYAAIPGGYWVLPANQLLADEFHSTRTAAWPITYRLQITPAGLLTFMYSYNGAAYKTVLTNWPLTTGNGPLPSTFRFGFAGATGGSNNTHEITCFVAEPSQSSSSAAANTVQAGQVRIGTQEYLASYNPNNWSASLVSKDLVNTNGVVSVSTVANWDGDCVLTGGGCATMGTDLTGTPSHTIAVESPSSRQLLTWNGTTGIPLQWASLTTAQKTLLNTSVLNTTDTNGQIRLSWLRGDRTNEQGATPAGPLRIRSGVLGDIINSSPTWVGPPNKNYKASFSDALYGTSGSETSYLSYVSDKATRMNVVYVGSNDGLVHGFRTGAFQSDGTTYNSTNNDGYELIGFMPSTVLANANVVRLTDPTYGHNYFVDAAPGTGDLYYNGSWHSWLVGSLGVGGAEVFALDVTDPSQFSESNASTLVMGDWTSSSLANLGDSNGTPLVRRLHNGQWAIIFGNGLGSSSDLGGVYIGLVNASTGAVDTFKWLSTGVGSSSTPNGIVSVESADIDADHVTDYLYAGDLLGNVWRFDLTSSNTSDWGVSKFGQPSATPLFIAKNSSGTRQPITTKLSAVASLTGGASRVILGFGTGQAIPATTTTPITYASGTQTFYGIWDWDMNAWNNGATTANSVTIPPSSMKYAALSETSPSYRTFARSDLLVDTLASSSGGYATSAITTVCWNGSAACLTGNNQYGWLFDLPNTGEQIIYNPAFSGGEYSVNTTIPPANSLGQCTPSRPSGWTRAFDVASGGGSKQNVFPDASGSLIVGSGKSSITGVQQNGVGTPWFVSIGSQQFSITQTVSGDPLVTKFNPQGGVTAKRVTWEQLR